MISIELNSVFSQAVEYAKKKHHEYLTVEHVFWSILQSSEGQELLGSLGVDTGVLSSEVLAHIDRTVPALSEAGDPIETVALSQVINDMMNHLHAPHNGKRRSEICWRH